MVEALFYLRWVSEIEQFHTLFGVKLTLHCAASLPRKWPVEFLPVLII